MGSTRQVSSSIASAGLPDSPDSSAHDPILFGPDTVALVLTDWDVYLAPRLNDLVPGTAH